MTRDGTMSAIRAAVDGLTAGTVLDGIGPLGGRERRDACSCRASIADGTLVLEASDCPGDGRLSAEPACRRTAVDALAKRDADRIVVRSNGIERHHYGQSVDLFAAAGRFVDRFGNTNDELAATARADPLSIGAQLRQPGTGHASEFGSGDGSPLVHETELVALANEFDAYESIPSPTIGLTIGHYRIDPTMPDDARLRDGRSLGTGSDVRLYDRRRGVTRYTLDPAELRLTEDERSQLLEGYEAIAEGVVDGDRAAARALEHVTGEPADPLLREILAKHTAGYGVLEDLFADPRLTDVYVTSPVSRNPLQAVVDGESMRTNVYLTIEGARALASRIRRTSGRAFSRAKPTVDATAPLESGTTVRVAGVTDPVSDGDAFAFREQTDDRFTLPALVANGTVSAQAAGFLSVAVERNAAALIAGSRSAGKTTLLGTLLYELPPETRTVVLEDTPELPVEALQSVGRNVQPLRTGGEDGPEITPEKALRTALRLGDGALVVGEIRGEEAQVLYEAMRVGANANAVLGTVHGDGADDVFERVVTDLGVAPSSFAATDLVVTLQSTRVDGERTRRLARIEEVVGDGDEHWFEPLYELGEREPERERGVGTDRGSPCATDGGNDPTIQRPERQPSVTAVPTGRIDRGESRVVERLATPDESYADVRRAIEQRTERLAALAADGRTRPREVAAACAGRHDRGGTTGG